MKEEPTLNNYVLRLGERSRDGDHLGCLADEVAAERILDDRPWYYLLRGTHTRGAVRLPSELEVASRTKRPRVGI